MIIVIVLASVAVGLFFVALRENQEVIGEALVASCDVLVVRGGASAPVDVPLSGERQVERRFRLIVQKLRRRRLRLERE